jgi:ATP-dependent RNA helicase DeaD
MKTGFEHYHIKHEVLEKIKEKGFTSPTSIQNKSIPFIMTGENAIIQSATGSGKTLCYLTKILSTIISGNGPQALILAPTKELVLQIKKEFEFFSKELNLTIVASYGGVAYKQHLDEIYKAEIIIGTTGRISDLVEQGAFELGRLQTVVLDEADEMLAKQYRGELEFILSQCPKKSQKLVFSATISKEDNAVLKHLFGGAKRITAETIVDPKKLKQVCYEIETNKKYSLLHYILKTEPIGLAIIFTNRQDTAEWLYRNLRTLKEFEIQLVHGDMGKGKREKILTEFKHAQFDILIATDIVARGIDVENVSHIINYTIPKDPEKYIHRIGRTARAGAKGKVINFISEKEIESMITILKEYKIHYIPKELPVFEEVEVKKQYKQKKPKR